MDAYMQRRKDMAQDMALAFHQPEKIEKAFRPRAARGAGRKWWGGDA